MAPVLEEVLEIVGIQMGKKRISEDDFFIEDLGAESMDIVNIIAAVEDRYSIEIPEEKISDLKTPRDLQRAIEKGMPPDSTPQ